MQSSVFRFGRGPQLTEDIRLTLTPMRGFVANTDFEWFRFLRGAVPSVDEVNFWKPGSNTRLSGLEAGEPLFFKLKAPQNAIAGFGYFSLFSILPTRLAWDVYGQANGAATYGEFRAMLTTIRKGLGIPTEPRADFDIGCVLLTNPVFFEPDDWIAPPDDFRKGIVQWKGYDLTYGEGSRVWMECLERAARYQPRSVEIGIRPSIIADAPIGAGYGPAALIRPRLGQRSFRIAVLDSYDRRCAVTNEKTLPVLEAAHIRDYSDLQEHSISNGILLRADIHKLFDAGYVTVTPDYHFQVSRRIKEEFENGRDYYALNGASIRLPKVPAHHPLVESLYWHNEERYLG